MDKHKLVRELNVPYRDLRILDPMVRATRPMAVCPPPHINAPPTDACRRRGSRSQRAHAP